MTTTTRKARQEGKGRKIRPKRAWIVENGHCATMHPHKFGYTGKFTEYLLLPLNEQADAARIEAGARIISTDFVDAPHQTERWWKTFKADYPALWKRSERTAHNFLSAIGALSTPGKKEKGAP
jgi:hypothetical protein